MCTNFLKVAFYEIKMGFGFLTSMHLLFVITKNIFNCIVNSFAIHASTSSAIFSYIIARTS